MYFNRSEDIYISFRGSEWRVHSCHIKALWPHEGLFRMVSHKISITNSTFCVGINLDHPFRPSIVNKMCLSTDNANKNSTSCRRTNMIFPQSPTRREEQDDLPQQNGAKNNASEEVTDITNVKSSPPMASNLQDDERVHLARNLRRMKRRLFLLAVQEGSSPSSARTSMV